MQALGYVRKNLHFPVSLEHIFLEVAMLIRCLGSVIFHCSYQIVPFIFQCPDTVFPTDILINFASTVLKLMVMQKMRGRNLVCRKTIFWYSNSPPVDVPVLVAAGRVMKCR